MNEKLNKISQLLSEHTFRVDDVNDDYKCIICKGIINNAYQAICGCNFCKECIDRLVNNGVIQCPGGTEECTSNNLSDVVINHRLNIQISKVVVKCPISNCHHQCKLIEMDEHFALCSEKSKNCSINNIESQSDDTVNVKLNECLMAGNDDHVKLLIESMGQLKNEMKQLKENNMIKDEAIESLRNEINSLKQKHLELKTQIRNNNTNLWNILDQMDFEMNNRCRNETVKSINDELESMRINRNELETQMKIIDRKCQELERNMQNINQVETRNVQITKKINKIDVGKNEMAESVYEIKDFLEKKHNGQLWWTIGRISEIKWMESEDFIDFQNPYQMQLRLEYVNSRLEIKLWIYREEFKDNDLIWPMRGDVKIEIIRSDDMNISTSITRPCTINKPKNNSWKSSDVIYFNNQVLVQKRLFNMKCRLFCSVTFSTMSQSSEKRAANLIRDLFPQSNSLF